MPSPCVCRLCGEKLNETFVDLGMSPLCESYVPADRLDEAEVSLPPARLRVCSSCLLVQLPAYVPGEDISPTSAYFSSYSDSSVRARQAVHQHDDGPASADVRSLVTEVASDDGCLLQPFVARASPYWVWTRRERGRDRPAGGVPTVVEFLGAETGEAIAARTAAPTSSPPTTCSRMCPTSTASPGVSAARE